MICGRGWTDQKIASRLFCRRHRSVGAGGNGKARDDGLRLFIAQRLSARDFERQVAEFQVRVAVLNGFTALGTPITDGRWISLSGERGRPVNSRFVQQSPGVRKRWSC